MRVPTVGLQKLSSITSASSKSCILSFSRSLILLLRTCPLFCHAVGAHSGLQDLSIQAGWVCTWEEVILTRPADSASFTLLTSLSSLCIGYYLDNLSFDAFGESLRELKLGICPAELSQLSSLRRLQVIELASYYTQYYDDGLAECFADMSCLSSISISNMEGVTTLGLSPETHPNLAVLLVDSMGGLYSLPEASYKFPHVKTVGIFHCCDLHNKWLLEPLTCPETGVASTVLQSLTLQGHPYTDDSELLMGSLSQFRNSTHLCLGYSPKFILHSAS